MFSFVSQRIQESRVAWVIGLFVLLGVTLYAPALQFPFVHDDVVLIRDNPQIRSWDGIGKEFLKSADEFQATGIASAYYRPVLEIVYRLEYQFFGEDARYYHLVNIVLHIVNALLLWRIGRSAGMRPGTALTAALLFLVHPVQTEAVVCISGISNLIFAGFLLLSLFLYLENAGQRAGRRIASVGLFVLALFSKEQAVILPLLLMAVELCVRRGDGPFWRRVVKRTWPYWVMTFAYLVWRQILFPDTLGSILHYPGELQLRVMAIPKILLTYWGLVWWPFDLHYYRSVDILTPMMGWWVLFMAVCLLFGTVTAAMPRTSGWRMTFGLWWFLAALLPTLNIAPMINEFSWILVAEHFLYVSLWGALVFTVVLVYEIIERLPLKDRNAGRQATLVVVTVALILLTVLQLQFWKDEPTLFRRSLTYERLARVHWLLARAEQSNKSYDEAAAEYLKAKDIMLDYAEKAGNPEALAYYHEFVKNVYGDMSTLNILRGRPDEAASYYRQALALDPDDTVIQNNLALLYLSQGHVDIAMHHFEAVLKTDPVNVPAMNNLALCYIRAGRFSDAELMLTRLLAVDPDYKPARRNLELLRQRIAE